MKKAMQMNWNVDQHLWFRAAAAQLSMLDRRWIKAAEVWELLIERYGAEYPVSALRWVLHATSAPNTYPTRLSISTKSYEKFKVLQSSFHKIYPQLPVSDSMFMQSLLNHYMEETPNAFAKGCFARLSTQRRDAQAEVSRLAKTGRSGH